MNPPRTTPRRVRKNTGKKFSLSFVETDINFAHPLKPMERAEGSQDLSESNTVETPLTPRRSLRVMAKSQLNATLDLSEFKTPANGTSTKKSKRATIAAADLAPGSAKKTPSKSVKTSMTKTKEDIETLDQGITDDGLSVSYASKKGAKRESVKEVAGETIPEGNNAEIQENGLNTTFNKDLEQADDMNPKNDSKDPTGPELASEELVFPDSVPEERIGATCLDYFDTKCDTANKKIDSNSFTIETASNESPENNNKLSDSLLTEDNDNSKTVGNTELNPEVDQGMEHDSNISGVAALTDDDEDADDGTNVVNKVLDPQKLVRVSVIDLTDSPASKPLENGNKTFSPSPRTKRPPVKEMPIKSGMVQKSRAVAKKVISSAKKQRMIESAKELVEEKRKKVEFEDQETKLGSATKFKKTPFKSENAQSK